MKIHIFVNEVAGGWLPDDIDRFLGGSEEMVVQLAEAFVNQGYATEVYHNRPDDCEVPDDESQFRNGVHYSPREFAHFGDKPQEEILICFKDPTPFIEGASVFKNIYVSASVENVWPLGAINHFVHISHYHSLRNVFVPLSLSRIIPLGVDLDHLESNRKEKTANTLLYCSSPDRGLETLLNDWPKIRDRNPEYQLRIAYGFQNYDKMGHLARAYKARMFELMNQDGISYLGSLTKNEIEAEYWNASYWVLPVIIPDSELFCLNALKARHCGAIPIVNKIGALKDTVGDYIPYANFVKGDTAILREPARYGALMWDQIVEECWLPLFRG